VKAKIALEMPPAHEWQPCTVRDGLRYFHEPFARIEYELLRLAVSAKSYWLV